MAQRRVTWPLRLYAGLLLVLLAVNAAGFAVGEVLRRMGPVPLGESITYSTLVTGRDGRLLRPFLTRDGYWRLQVTAGDVDERYLRMLIAYEDKRFYSHRGIDPAALARAAFQALRHGRVACSSHGHAAASPTSLPR
jgi:penicillin-binding protein 1C